MWKLQADIISLSDKGLVRENNEDFYDVAQLQEGILCTVCDGIGGHCR